LKRERVRREFPKRLDLYFPPKLLWWNSFHMNFKIFDGIQCCDPYGHVGKFTPGMKNTSKIICFSSIPKVCVG
jgi:hypothetical protein